MLHIRNLIALVLVAFLVACTGGGGGNGDNNDNDGNDDVVNVGILLNSPVKNIGYRTNSKQGYTNASGEFTYLEGESVTFYIGDLELPEVVAKPVITPLDLTGANDIRDNRVVNISRLLQTLDAEPDNMSRIVIHDQAHRSATQVDFSLSPSHFENLAAVQVLIFNAGQATPPAGMVTPQQSIDRLMASLDQRGIPYTDSHEDRGLAIASRFRGNWVGSGINRFTGGTESFAITVKPDRVLGRNLTGDCGADFSIFKSSEYEVILQGANVTGPCWPDPPVRLTYRSDNSLLMTVYLTGRAEFIDSSMVGITAELTRK